MNIEYIKIMLIVNGFLSLVEFHFTAFFMPLLIFLYENLQLFGLETFEYLKKIVASEGVLSSLQFGFTALLTLLVPLLIEVYKDQENTDALDKIVLNRVVGFNYQWKSLNLKGPNLIAYITIVFILSQFFNLVVNLTISLILILFLFWKTLKIIDFTLDKDKYKLKEIEESKSEEVLEYFENYFLTNAKMVLNNSFEKRRSFNQEKKFVSLFFNKIDNLDFKKDAEFAAQMIQVFLQGFDNINFEVFSYESSILDKLLLWHKQAWENYWTEIIKNDKDNNNRHDNLNLEGVLMDLINKILEKSLRENDMVFSDLIKKIDKHLEENKDFYINNQNFDFHNTLLNNLHKSSFLSKIKNDDSNYYFPEKWRISIENKIGKYNWWQFIIVWIFPKINSAKLQDNYDSVENQQIRAVIEVFFKDLDHEYLIYILTYYMSFVWGNYEATDRIRKFLDFTFDFMPWLGRSYVFSYSEDSIGNKTKKYQSYSLEICKKLKMFPSLENVTKDIEEIKSLEKDETLDFNQKNKLNTIKQIWEEIWEEIQKYTP